MQRRKVKPRPDWKRSVEELGFECHSYADAPYWDESACYLLTKAEAEEIWRVTAEVNTRLLEAGEKIVSGDLFERLGVPLGAVPNVLRSWERDDPTIISRFDLVRDAAGRFRLYEFQGDSPAMLLESALVQWKWKESAAPRAGQYNTIHERLIERWRELNFPGRTVHFAALRMSGDQAFCDLSYLRETAREAGVQTRQLALREIRWSESRRRFAGPKDEEIEALFKIYPWERLLTDRYGGFLLEEPLLVIEPAWKLMFESRGILALLWEMYPDHAALLPAFWGPEGRGGVLRELPLFRGPPPDEEPGFGERGTRALVFPGDRAVYQQAPEAAAVGGYYPVFSSWLIGGEPVGVGIKEYDSARLDGRCRFVPHLLV